MVKINMVIAAQIFRLISACFTLISDKSTSKKKILEYNSVSNFFCAIQYFCLNAITGGICSLIPILRNIMMQKSKKKLPIYMIIIFLAGSFLCNLGNLGDIISYIPFSLVVIYTLGLYSENMYILKISIILTCILEIIYDVIFKAYVGIGVCVMDIFLVIISIKKIKTSKC